MAGIIKRFTDIMSSNINALLDKAEDPAKMIDQYLRDLEGDLGKVKSETAAVMAEEARAKRELEACSAEADKMQRYAEKAVMAGNDGDACKFLEEKKRLAEKQAQLQKTCEAASANAYKMRSMHDKLVSDIKELKDRRQAVKAKVAVAKTQERLNKLDSSIRGAADGMSAFERMEAKADRMLEEANAVSKLNRAENEKDIDQLAKKYDHAASADVADELEALKAKMGLS